jgi:Carboxypeptidase regulatory-like domain
VRVFWRVFLIVFCVSTVALAQVDRGSITGTVTDATGAVIPGVSVGLVETETGVHYEGDTTNERGIYRVLNLPVGKYALTFVRDGFKTYNRTGVTVAMSQNITLNAKLEVGSRTESVVVTADASLLDTQDGILGSTVSGEVLTDLPLTADGGRDARNFARSVVATYSTVTGPQLGYNNSVAGSQIVSQATSVDGTSADAGIMGIVNAPGMDSISQFQVQTSGISAASAQTGGGELMYELKSGTNSFHGSAFGFLANEALNANGWDNNYFLSQCAAGDTTCKQNYKRPLDRYHDLGFSASGPLWKSHTFVFGSYERFRKQNMTYQPEGATVPTVKMLNGDFSELLNAVTVNPTTGNACTAPCPTGQLDASGNPIYYGAIFNPLSPGNVFPGNIIPAADISPQSKKVMQIFQQDYAPENGNLINNYWGFATFGNFPINTNYHLDLKVDHNFSQKNHANASYNRYQETPIETSGLWQHGSSDGGPFTQSYVQGTLGWEVRLQDYYTITPNLVNFASADYNYWLRWDVTSHPVDNSALGFPSDSSGANNFPNMSFAGNNNYGEPGLGANKADHLPYYQGHYKDELSWVHGRHVYKFGGEFISYGANSTEADGYLNYTFNSNTGEPLSIYNNASVSPYVGFGFANFELGEVGGASKAVGGHLRGRRKGLNFYGEDTIKLTPKLTLDASLRWDFNTAWKEVNGQWSNFDTSGTNASWNPLPGAYQFLSNGGQSFEKNQDLHLFSPHVGASYQISKKLVVRGTYGLFYVPLGIDQWGGAPFAGEASFGYTGQNIMPAPVTPVNSIYQWDGGTTYPGNPTAPTRDPNANLICPYCTISVDPNKLDLGHTNNWNVGGEYEIAKNTVIDLNYIGNRGGNLHDGSDDPRNSPTWANYQSLLQKNCGGATYASCAGQWVASQSDAQLAGVNWYPFIPSMTNGAGGYSATDALKPFPQTGQSGGVMFTDSAIGSSRYDAMVVEIKRRTDKGLSADLSYTFSHEAGNVNRANGNFAENWGGGDPYQDPYALDQMKNLISPNDVRHEVKGYVSYALPFGSGRRWLSSGNELLKQTVGGWNLATQVDYHGGQPMGAVRPSFWSYPNWGNTFANVVKTPGALKNNFKHLDLNNLNDVSNQFVNPASFTDLFNPDGSGAYLGTLGNQEPYNSNWRGWAYNNEDLSILKKFGFHDNRYRATLRAEFFDVFNRHHWGSPNTGNIGAQYFGNVTSVSGSRQAQLGARFEW